jgi:hypothetical protein
MFYGDDLETIFSLDGAALSITVTFFVVGMGMLLWRFSTFRKKMLRAFHVAFFSVN